MKQFKICDTQETADAAFKQNKEIWEQLVKESCMSKVEFMKTAPAIHYLETVEIARGMYLDIDLNMPELEPTFGHTIQ